MENNVLYLVVAVLIAAIVLFAIAKRAKLSLEHGKSKLSVAPETAQLSATPNPTGIKARGIEAGRNFTATDNTGRGIDAANVKAGEDVRLETDLESKA